MSGKLNRRKVLGIGGAGAAAVLLGTGAWSSAAADVRLRGGYPFSLGVASGDPLPDGVVLWTRLAPEPLAADGSGGMPAKPVQVQYEVATDESFRDVVRRGSATATPELGHSVHAEISGLQPGRDYFYRFRAAGELSPVGRTRTAPADAAALASLSFAFASCQHWKDGFFTAYEHMAGEDLDFVVHLGDYLYEYDQTDNKRGVALGSEFKSETASLDRYRLQYSLFKTDPHLQSAHAAFPWITTMDDHEVDNNWAGEISQDDDDTAVFLRRRAAAFQAMYENLPLRRTAMPDGPNVRLHRRLKFGDLADLTMIDTRQYRDDQPCGDGSKYDCAERLDPRRTILGEQQREWLLDGFYWNRSKWQILGNQAPMGETDLDAGPAKKLFMDPWDGYVAERNAVLAGAAHRGVRNLVVITGDRHQNYAWDLKRDFEDPDSPTVASEFVGTSISSGGDGADMTDEGRTMLAANPHMKFFNAQRGYVRCTLTPELWRSDYRVVPYIERRGAPISTRATYVVENGRPGVQPA
ncbi:alkaline phosphatase D [Saccharopolyspora antimicrobica]|uniref:Alkaline phosphatase D n=1 Tax=Saccharopolyspora antimicrobica TaxID=455193 RepID=A0A1I4W6H7_9PSEU|nr:alkaline phosphatase D family protein [Saccharopolyspora antimicrobica]RKT87049.1 alkaline phosphatase D [Saccharopolyspora antimicrobica]SFN08806.1 alkaline phosphatase D [Saccharopolyspora antimicrobica]